METNEPAKKAFSKQELARLLIGIITFAFALLGVVSLILFGAKAVNRQKEKRLNEKYAAYNRFLIPIAAIDMEPFDDISTASMSELVEVSVWSVLNAGLDPAGLEYQEGNLILPKELVENAYKELFGDETTLVHCSVEGYGYEFSYNETAGNYTIPITTISPVFTPYIQSEETKGGATVITCGLVNASFWTQNTGTGIETGALAAPAPDRYIKVTLRSAGNVRYISAIQLTGAPETALTEAVLPETKTETTTQAPVQISEESTREEFTTSDKGKITRIE